MKNYTGNAYSQAQQFNKIKVAEEKANVVKQAFVYANDVLSKSFGSLEIDLQKENLFEVSAGAYSGEVDAAVAIYTTSGLTRVPVTIHVEASKPYFFEGDANVITRISEQLSDFEGDRDEQLAKYSDEADAKIQKIDEEQAMKDQVSQNIEAGMDLSEAYKSVYTTFNTELEVTAAKHYIDTDAGYAAGIMSTPPEVFEVNKVAYPLDAEIGDSVNISGVNYKIVESAHNSSSAEGGAQWILRKTN